ncbi:hypothetical protein J0H58_36215 [bacterium]|nr:hypothetical protein [bacterium]
MRIRSLVAGLAVVLSADPGATQPAPPRTPAPPLGPSRPIVFPAPLAQPAPVSPGVPLTAPLPVAPPAVVAPPTELAPLPYPENLAPIDAGLLSARPTVTGWQVALGQRVFRELGTDEQGAKDLVRVLRELRPTDWCVIGTGRPVVEYGLQNGKVPTVSGFPRSTTPIDLQTVRVDTIRGVWVVRDDASIHFNCGLNRPDAEQVVAVIRRYGFNRVGRVGANPNNPAMAYLYATLAGDGGGAVNPLAAAVAEQSLTRVGIPVPGVGYFGELVRIDPRRTVARKDGSEWLVAAGDEVLAKFGPAEFTARDAARVVQEGRFTEFCRAGGQTFFLVNGKAPTRVPFSTVVRHFDPTALRAGSYGTRWAVTENGRHLFDAADQAEAEGLVRLVRHFGFDTVCQVGTPPRAGLSFLAKSR